MVVVLWGGGEGALNEARGVLVSAEAILSWRCGSLRRGALPALMWKGARRKGRSEEAYSEVGGDIQRDSLQG